MQIANLRLLVAEDQNIQRRILVEMLTSLGAKDVLEAIDGNSALEMIRSQHPPIDIVITDLDMPGMDGMAFIRHLGGESSVSVVIISALRRSLLASVETMAAAYGVPLLGVVSKPATVDKLKVLIEAHEQGRVKKRRSHYVAPTFTLEEIKEGLQNDEFEPFFQPKIKLATREIKGAEALARWRHPDMGIIAPIAFITQLENGGLIDKLTFVMLRKAAAYCSAWHAAGVEGCVSVNLSIKSLTDLDLAARLTDLVRSENLAPRHVVLEVTESAATTETGKALENLSRLLISGFGLSIDDYGTGYSSMQQLMRIAFTELKIDQSFVRNAARQESSRIILESSISLAKRLGIVAVAEGVETKAEWDLLIELGCELAQGYFIAPPMEAKVYLDWVGAWTGAS